MIGTAFLCFYALMAALCFGLLWFTKNDRGWLRGLSFTCMAMCVGLSGLVAGLSLISSGNWNRPIGDPIERKEQVEIVVEKTPAAPKVFPEMPSPTMRSMTREEQDRARREVLEAALADARRQAELARREAAKNASFTQPYESAPQPRSLPYNHIPPSQRENGELSRFAYDGDEDFSSWVGVEESRRAARPSRMAEGEPQNGEFETAQGEIPGYDYSQSAPLPPGEGEASVSPIKPYAKPLPEGAPEEVWFPDKASE